MRARNPRLRRLRSSAIPLRGAGPRQHLCRDGRRPYVAPVVAEAHAGSLALESDRDSKGDHVRVKLPL
jgi:hypothetical protein